MVLTVFHMKGIGMARPQPSQQELTESALHALDNLEAKASEIVGSIHQTASDARVTHCATLAGVSPRQLQERPKKHSTVTDYDINTWVSDAVDMASAAVGGTTSGLPSRAPALLRWSTTPPALIGGELSPIRCETETMPPVFRTRYMYASLHSSIEREF